MRLSVITLALTLASASASSLSSSALAARRQRHVARLSKPLKRTVGDPTAPVVIPAASDLPEDWEVLASCAKDETRVMVQPDVWSLADNTPAKCVAFCDNNGYTYAGVEWAQECWCSRAIAPELLETAPDSECNMPCTGDKTQACGAGGRMQLFYSTSTSQWDDAPLSPGWSTALQCAVDSRALRTLCNLRVYSMDEANSPAACTALCQANGYKFAGVEYGKECHCGTGFSLGLLANVVEAPMQECWMGCAGDDSLACGAPDRIQIYVLNNAVSAPVCVEKGITITIPLGQSTTTSTSTSTSSTSSTTSRSSSTTTSSSSSTTTPRITTTTTTTTTSRSTSARPTYRPPRTWRPKPCNKSTSTTTTTSSTTTARSTTTTSSSTTVRSTTTTSAAPTATAKPPVTVNPGAQCGGLFWFGCRTCSSGYKCVYRNFLISTCQK